MSSTSAAPKRSSIKDYLRSQGWAIHEKGDPAAVFANAVKMLLQLPDFHDRFRFNQLQLATFLVSHLPGQTDTAPCPRLLTEDDVLHVLAMLQRSRLTRLGYEATRQAIEFVAHRHAFHPIRDWLDTLQWDGQPRTHTWLHRIFGAEANDYHASIGMWFLRSMVARVYHPGCKCDYMPVLEGPQGILKSQALKILAGDWFDDHMPDLSSDPVRVSQHLRGKWLIEISELSSISRADSALLKAFLTRTHEVYTPKYARTEVREARQGVLAGTTNKSGYLRDETGGRRFWPIICGIINLALLVADRDQLFAEAVHDIKHGAAYWPDQAFEERYVRPVQQAAFEADAWEEKIEHHLEHQTQVTVLSIAQDVLYFDLPKLGTNDQRRIVAVLERLGWTRQRTDKARLWIAPRQPP